MTTFPDVCRKVEDNYRRERESGFLCLDAMRHAIAFGAAEAIVAAGRPPDLNGLPPWLTSELYQWLEEYVKEGKLTFVSNLGEVDHSGVAEQLSRLLPPKESVGPSVDLLTEELCYPSSRRVHQYFTYYLSVPDGVKVRHGLHREYTESGTLVETEFRHGAAIGQPRAFDEKGQKIKQCT